MEKFGKKITLKAFLRNFFIITFKLLADRGQIEGSSSIYVFRKIEKICIYSKILGENRSIVLYLYLFYLFVLEPILHIRGSCEILNLFNFPADLLSCQSVCPSIYMYDVCLV